MDVFLILLLLVVIIGMKIAPKGTIFNDVGLDKDHTAALRGFLCVLIVLDHSSLLTGCGYSVVVLKRAGPYVVALFYALSAYGLMSSYVKSGFSLKGFWKKRLLGTILPYLLFSLFAVILRWFIKEPVSVKGILLSFVNGHPLVLYSWFIVTIIAFYVVFYLSALLAKKDTRLLTVLVGFFLFFFVFGMQKLDFEDFWFNAAWAFPLGLCWKLIYSRISGIFRKHPLIHLSLSGLIAAWWIAIAEYYFWFGYLARLCSTLAVCIFVLLLMFKLKIGNPVLRFWGKISLEIYLCHGLLVTLLSSFLSPTKYPYFFVAILLSGSILLAWLLSLLFGAIWNMVFKKRKHS